MGLPGSGAPLAQPFAVTVAAQVCAALNQGPLLGHHVYSLISFCMIAANLVLSDKAVAYYRLASYCLLYAQEYLSIASVLTVHQVLVQLCCPW